MTWPNLAQVHHIKFNQNWSCGFSIVVYERGKVMDGPLSLHSVSENSATKN